MSYTRGGLLALLLAGVAGSQPASPAEAYQALTREYAAAFEQYQKAASAAATDEAKAKAFRTSYPHPAAWSPRFAAFARRYPTSRQAVDALTWLITHPVEQTAPEHALRAKALETLRTSHMDDERLGPICTGLVYTIDRPSEEFLRAVFAKAPKAGTQARACASLAHNFKYRSRLVRALREDADMLKEYEKTYGKAILAELLKSDPDALVVESKKLFRYVALKHPAVAHPAHGTLGKLAESHLLSLESPVAIDRPAPEIDGTDADGKPLKLSDHKGKVVLLDFWGGGLLSSRAALGYEKGLVKRLAGQPFVILGVSSDPDRVALSKLITAQGLTWRSWWDGGYVGGPIATRWEIDHWPTLVLIDHEGVVREMSLGWPEPKVLDATIDKLVSAAKKGK